MKLLTTLFLLSSCAHEFKKTVTNVDRDKFMGTWHVMAGRFTSFEKDVYNSVEKYSWDEKNQKILIDFRYNKGSLNGPVKKLPQTAWITNKNTNATWKVSPFWPLRFTYLIIALDEKNYQWTAIGVPGQDYLWIMTRDPKTPRAQTNEIIQKVESLGYSIKDIVYVEHGN